MTAVHDNDRSRMPSRRAWLTFAAVILGLGAVYSLYGLWLLQGLSVPEVEPVAFDQARWKSDQHPFETRRAMLDDLLQRDFIGMSEAELTELLGPPNTTRADGTMRWNIGQERSIFPLDPILISFVMEDGAVRSVEVPPH